MPNQPSTSPALLPAFVSFEWIIYALFSSLSIWALADAGADVRWYEQFLFAFIMFPLSLLQLVSALLLFTIYKGILRAIYLFLFGFFVLGGIAYANTEIDAYIPEIALFIYPICLAWYYTIVCFMDSLKRRAQLSNRS